MPACSRHRGTSKTLPTLSMLNKGSSRRVVEGSSVLLYQPAKHLVSAGWRNEQHKQQCPVNLKHKSGRRHKAGKLGSLVHPSWSRRSKMITAAAMTKGTASSAPRANATHILRKTCKCRTRNRTALRLTVEISRHCMLGKMMSQGPHTTGFSALQATSSDLARFRVQMQIVGWMATKATHPDKDGLRSPGFKGES